MRRLELHRLCAAIALLPLAALAQRGDDGLSLEREVAALAPSIVALRHRIHERPELGNREVETARLVAEHLTALGFEVQTGIAHTGVVGILRGGRPGAVVAVRADMDALPVEEETDLPYRSTVRTTYLGQDVGVMHACGHDVHTAVQLGVASLLAGMRERIPGTVKLIFQPAEEGPPPGERGGAELMLAEGVFEDPAPAAIFGLHSDPDLDAGRVGYVAGPTFAAVDQFLAAIVGRQTHGAEPHLGTDPIVIAAEAIGALQTIRSRTLSPLEPSVVTVGLVRGGTRWNIIPERVELEGTVRTYSPATQATIERRMHEILDGVSRAGGARYELEYRRITPVTVNDPALSAELARVLEGTLGTDRVVVQTPVMAGEDFAYFADAVPGFFFRLGTRPPGGTSGGLHTPTFVADDAAVEIGMRAMASLVLEFLEARAR